MGNQLELELKRKKEPDRNWHKGGRSFYFFDFDDNLAFLTTPTFLFHKETGSEVIVTSGEFVEHKDQVGRVGPYRDYEIRFDDMTGSFRNFRDQDLTAIEKIAGQRQAFVEDLAGALGHPNLHWQGPSWSCFYHAVFNERPLALITARGHHPETLKDGVRLFVEENHLPSEPNYLGVFPVSHPEVRQDLGGGLSTPVARLKQLAIRESVERAIKSYGESPHHRFGMSDDDPANIEKIIEEMAALKTDFPQMSFFVIETFRGQFIKREVFSGHTVDQCVTDQGQLELF